MNIIWIIQNNLLNKQNIDSIKQVCKNNDMNYISWDIIPFQDEVIDFYFNKNQKIIFYGSTRIANVLYENNCWNGCIYYDKDKFTYRNYLDKYKDKMLNYDCEIIKIKDVMNSSLWKNNYHLFMRPDKDLKEFAGMIINGSNYESWVKSIIENELLDVNENTEVVLSTKKDIEDEWRVFIVGGKVSSCSHYRTFGRLNIYKDDNEQVKEFCENLNKNYSPSDVFVMDVCKYEDELKIIEINCFNSSGFYDCDIEKIFIDIVNFEKRFLLF